MPFVTGNPDVSRPDPYQLPWVYDGTYEIFVPKISLPYNSTAKSAQYIIKHAQIISMLYIIKYYNPKIMDFPCEYAYLNMDAETIEDYKEHNKIPPVLEAGFKSYNYFKEQDYGFRIVQCTKYSQRLFPHMDTLQKDEKVISMALQESVNHRVRVYKEINTDRNEEYYIILTNQWTWDMARKIIALMPKLYPELHIPDEVLPIFGLFGTTKFDEWCAAYNNWVQTLHLMDDAKKSHLEKILNANIDKQISDLKYSADNILAQITQYLNEITNLNKSRQEKLMSLYGYEHQERFSADDFFQYLQRNKAILKYNITDTQLALTIRTTWNYFDQKFFDTMIKNPRSDIHSHRNMVKLMPSIYSENPRFELWVDAPIVIDFTKNTFTAANNAAPELLPQIHLYRFQCWGANSALIKKALINKDYILMLEQIIAAVKNINWSDGIVMGYVYDYLDGSYKAHKTIKDLKTGEFISVIEALDILNKEATSNEVDKDNPSTAASNA